MTGKGRYYTLKKVYLKDTIAVSDGIYPDITMGRPVMKKCRRMGLFLCVILAFLLAGCGTDPYAEVPVQIWEPLESEDSKEITNDDIEESTEESLVEEVETKEPLPPEPVEVTILISAAGDVTLGNHQAQEYGSSFMQKYDQEGEQYFLQNVKDIFSKDDLTIVNFEGVLTTSEERRQTTYNMKGDPSYINILTEGSVEAVGFANNHQHDYLDQGIKDTVECFEKAGLTYAYDKITGIYETKGIKIGIVALNEVEQGSGVETYVESGINALKEAGVNLIIVSCHWGIEKDNYPESYQTTLGRKCIDLGADLVLGHHPHVLQGVEVYNGKFIVYSLANFCFGGNRSPKDKDTMIFQQEFKFVDGVKVEDTSAKVIPCKVSSVNTHNDFCPTPATGEEYDKILKRINEYSQPYKTQFDENGNYIKED